MSRTLYIKHIDLIPVFNWEINETDSTIISNFKTTANPHTPVQVLITFALMHVCVVDVLHVDFAN